MNRTVVCLKKGQNRLYNHEPNMWLMVSKSLTRSVHNFLIKKKLIRTCQFSVSLQGLIIAARYYSLVVNWAYNFTNVLPFDIHTPCVFYLFDHIKHHQCIYSNQYPSKKPYSGLK